jgi:hypothetical protein
VTALLPGREESVEVSSSTVSLTSSRVTQQREIQYLVLPNAAEPFLLARVRWPDVYQAISPVRRDWQNDPGLFDLPYAPNSTAITPEAAARLATEWGAELPSEDEAQSSGLSLIRRLPSDWSSLSTSERRAWAIDDRPAGRSVTLPLVSAFWGSIRRRWGRRRDESAESFAVEGLLLQDEAAADGPVPAAAA